MIVFGGGVLRMNTHPGCPGRRHDTASPDARAVCALPTTPPCVGDATDGEGVDQAACRAVTVAVEVTNLPLSFEEDETIRSLSSQISVALVTFSPMSASRSWSEIVFFWSATAFAPSTTVQVRANARELRAPDTRVQLCVCAKKSKAELLIDKITIVLFLVQLIFVIIFSSAISNIICF